MLRRFHSTRSFPNENQHQNIQDHSSCTDSSNEMIQQLRQQLIESEYRHQLYVQETDSQLHRLRQEVIQLEQKLRDEQEAHKKVLRQQVEWMQWCEQEDERLFNGSASSPRARHLSMPSMERSRSVTLSPFMSPLSSASSRSPRDSHQTSRTISIPSTPIASDKWYTKRSRSMCAPSHPSLALQYSSLNDESCLTLRPQPLLATGRPRSRSAIEMIHPKLSSL